MSHIDRYIVFSWLLIFVSLASTANSSGLIHEFSNGPFKSVNYDPPELTEFRTGEIRVLAITFQSDQNVTGFLSFEFQLLSTENGFSQTIDVQIYAKLLGINNLRIKFNNTLLDNTYELRLLRSARDHVLTKFFTVFAGTFVVCVTFMMGTQLDFGRVKEIIRRPIGPLIGFLCQFFIMPLLAFVLAVVFIPADQTALRFALLATGCSPGGGKSSFWTIIFDGNLDLSVSMTFTQTIAALGMMPLWIYTLGAVFFTERVQIPFLNIFGSLLALIIPSICGMIFIHYKKHLVEKFAKWIKIVTWIAAALFTIIGLYINFYIIYKFTWSIVICGCALPWSGYVIAYFVAWLFRQQHRERITIAIETGIQNIGIAILMLMVSLPEPESDLSIIMPIAIVLLTDKPLIIIWLVQKCYRKYHKTDDEETVETKCGSINTESTDSLQNGITLHLNGKCPTDAKMKYTRRDSLPPCYDNPVTVSA
uniref:Ileal sodium/bile acid cotransporter n=1 Tax=Acrobeloides nanus TaxID=290746 RepID=A0A914CS64_9BILA